MESKMLYHVNEVKKYIFIYKGFNSLVRKLWDVYAFNWYIRVGEIKSEMKLLGFQKVKYELS